MYRVTPLRILVIIATVAVTINSCLQWWACCSADAVRTDAVQQHGGKPCRDAGDMVAVRQPDCEHLSAWRRRWYLACTLHAACRETLGDDWLCAGEQADVSRWQVSDCTQAAAASARARNRWQQGYRNLCTHAVLRRDSGKRVSSRDSCMQQLRGAAERWVQSVAGQTGRTGSIEAGSMYSTRSKVLNCGLTSHQASPKTHVFQNSISWYLQNRFLQKSNYV
jgi:hypothetical protein